MHARWNYPLCIQRCNKECLLSKTPKRVLESFFDRLFSISTCLMLSTLIKPLISFHCITFGRWHLPQHISPCSPLEQVSTPPTEKPQVSHTNPVTRGTTYINSHAFLDETTVYFCYRYSDKLKFYISWV